MKHALAFAGAVVAVIFVACGRTPVPVHPDVSGEQVAGRPQTDVAVGSGARASVPTPSPPSMPTASSTGAGRGSATGSRPEDSSAWSGS